MIEYAQYEDSTPIKVWNSMFIQTFFVKERTFFGVEHDDLAIVSSLHLKLFV